MTRKIGESTIVVDRRSVIVGAGAAALSGLAPRSARAQAKVAPPTIIKAGTLVMSINPTLPPLQFVDDKGELKGLRVELGNEVAKWLGLTHEYVRIEFAAMIPGLAAKRWDMINTGIFWTEERSKLMYMVPYERAAVSFLVTRGNPLKIQKWEDLAGHAVSVELGGIEERRTREVDTMLKAKGMKGIDIRTFNNFAESFQALRAGQVQAATAIDNVHLNEQFRSFAIAEERLRIAHEMHDGFAQVLRQQGDALRGALAGRDRELQRLYDTETALRSTVDDQSGHLGRLYAEIERLNAAIRGMEATRAWRLHRRWQRWFGG